jgi:hypothetical protein
MQPHQERVVAESNELRERFTKLVAFIDGAVFQGLDVENRWLLERQREVMSEYLEILRQRIAIFY